MIKLQCLLQLVRISHQYTNLIFCADALLLNMQTEHTSEIQKGVCVWGGGWGRGVSVSVRPYRFFDLTFFAPKMQFQSYWHLLVSISN